MPKNYKSVAFQGFKFAAAMFGSVAYGSANFYYNEDDPSAPVSAHDHEQIHPQPLFCRGQQEEMDIIARMKLQDSHAKREHHKLMTESSKRRRLFRKKAKEEYLKTKRQHQAEIRSKMLAKAGDEGARAVRDDSDIERERRHQQALAEGKVREQENREYDRRELEKARAERIAKEKEDQLTEDLQAILAYKRHKNACTRQRIKQNNMRHAQRMAELKKERDMTNAYYQNKSMELGMQTVAFLQDFVMANGSEEEKREWMQAISGDDSSGEREDQKKPTEISKRRELSNKRAEAERLKRKQHARAGSGNTIPVTGGGDDTAARAVLDSAVQKHPRTDVKHDDSETPKGPLHGVLHNALNNNKMSGPQVKHFAGHFAQNEASNANCELARCIRDFQHQSDARKKEIQQLRGQLLTTQQESLAKEVETQGLDWEDMQERFRSDCQQHEQAMDSLDNERNQIRAQARHNADMIASQSFARIVQMARSSGDEKFKQEMEDLAQQHSAELVKAQNRKAAAGRP